MKNYSTDSAQLTTLNYQNKETKMTKKAKRIEDDIRDMKHRLELVRTIVPVLVLILQVFILGRIL